MMVTLKPVFRKYCSPKSPQKSEAYYEHQQKVDISAPQATPGLREIPEAIIK